MSEITLHTSSLIEIPIKGRRYETSNKCLYCGVEVADNEESYTHEVSELIDDILVLTKRPCCKKCYDYNSKLWMEWEEMKSRRYE